LKGEALDRTVWRSGFGSGCGLVIRQTTELRTACSNTAVVRVQT